MLTYRIYALAAVSATLLAANLHRNDAELAEPNVQTEQSHQGPPDSQAQAASYLPDLFVEEERAARIEPLPPQF